MFILKELRARTCVCQPRSRQRAARRKRLVSRPTARGFTRCQLRFGDEQASRVGYDCIVAHVGVRSGLQGPLAGPTLHQDLDRSNHTK